MGVDSRAFLPNISKENIRDFMKNVASNVVLKDSNVDEEYKVLLFSYRGEDRKLNLHQRYLNKNDYVNHVIERYSIDKEEAEQWWKDDEVEAAKATGLPLGNNGTYCSLGYWGTSVEILKTLCYRFGGYLDESDSDSEDYYKVKKNPREIVKIIFKG